MILRPLRCAALAALCSTLPACGLVLDAPDYHLATETPESPLRASEELIQAFGPDSPACTSCLMDGACGQAFDDCAVINECRELAVCLRERPSPASDPSCVVSQEPSEATRDMARVLLDCWRGCFNECGGGPDFACANDYTWPTPPRDVVRLTQMLTFVRDRADKAVAGARVSVCPVEAGPLEQPCETPLQLGAEPATTNEQGTYTVDVPIDLSPSPLAGFRGYRVVTGDGFLPHRLQRNAPILVDHEERTRLLDGPDTDVLVGLLGIQLFLQVFDCGGVGAGGVYLEVTNASGATVHYKDGVSEHAETEVGPTQASQEGAAFVVNLEPGGPYRIEGRLENDELVVAGDVIVPPDTIVMFGLYPNARP